MGFLTINISLPNALSLFACPKRGNKREFVEPAFCVTAKKGTLPNASSRKANAPLAGQRGSRTFFTGWCCALRLEVSYN